MRESETFQGELGRVAAELRAARAFLQARQRAIGVTRLLEP
jgi:hypothetical protein